MTSVQSKLEHLEWAIQSRAKNQRCALRLLVLFKEHENKWKSKKWSRAAQNLIAVSFSLWRAAFLADKTSKRADVFEHGRDFLERIIEDNAISYPQDKSSREWTFNYYTRNAKSALQELSKYWPENVPLYNGQTRNPMERWDYCQALLEEAVTNFESLLTEQAAKKHRAQERRNARTDRRRRRRTVRQLTLANRNSSRTPPNNLKRCAGRARAGHTANAASLRRLAFAGHDTGNGNGAVTNHIACR
jgi:hypothetical protein